MNPYLAGFGLGLVLLSSFVLMGWGLGASSAFATGVASCLSVFAPEHVASNTFFSDHIAEGSGWLVSLVAGVFIGGMVSGLLGSRTSVEIERGPRIGKAPRLALAFVGGALMAIGAKIGGGCTSGQALTGGSLLNAGSWVFMICVFGGAYGLAWFLRRQWI